MSDQDLKKPAQYDETPMSARVFRILLTVVGIVYGLFFLGLYILR